MGADEEAVGQTSPAEVGRFFRRYGWSAERTEDDTFRTGFRGKNASFVAMVRVTKHWVVFAVNPLVRAPEHGFGPAVRMAVLRANTDTPLVKLGLDDDGDIFANVELPTEGFCFAHFERALSALSHAADNLVVPLLQAQAIDARNG